MQEKLYYSISEVAEILEEKPTVIRHWQKEFPKLNPLKNAKGERRYKQKDIDILLRIKDLLRNQGFTIEGAKKQMIEFHDSKVENKALISTLLDIKAQLLDIKSKLT